MVNLQNITVFGDSIAKGVFLEGRQVKPLNTNAVKMIENAFNAEIKNNSQFGQTLKKVVERKMIEKFCENMVSNNTVVLALGGNDADFNWAEVEKSPNDFHDSKTNLWQFEEMLSNVIQTLKSFGANVVVCSLCPVCSKQYFENVLSKNFDGEKIKQFLQGDIENIYRHQELFNLALFKVAVKNGCYFFDYRSEFLKTTNLKKLLCEDGIHPNEKGQELIANLAIEKLSNNQLKTIEILKRKTFALQNVVLQKNVPRHFAFKHIFAKQH